VYAFTVIRHAVLPSMASSLPVVPVVVELEDAGVRVVAPTAPGVEVSAIAIGRRCSIGWHAVRRDTVVPVVVPQ
jgi:hypothetical protein